MFELPTIDLGKKENETFFNIDEMPSMEDDSSDRFIDIKREKDAENSFLQRETFNIPANESSFKADMYKRAGNKVTLQFKIEKDALSALTRTTGGLITTDIQNGSYEFEIIKQPNNDLEDIYYQGEYVGEVTDGKPRIYKRMFIMATIRSMVRQDILLEYEPGQFTVHPDFMAGLNLMTQEILTDTFKKNGSLMVDKEKLATMLHPKKQ